ncbi:MAG: 2-oxo acid dehydrogenase subunit E2 [Planctomycetes bacterium]|nr:2-oxo acid dehydrogenase subunit E2 [Planctomycetota bacterium]
MSQATGRYIPVSYFRRLVTDLMHFSAKVPGATIERRMNLGRLVAAREACTPAPTWSAIFAKAFAMVAARTPALRTSYLTFPWPRFYEHFTNIATINIDRELADERIVLFAHIPSPETRTLREIDAIIRHHQLEPVDNIPSNRWALFLSRVPWPFRRLLWWAALSMRGSIRCRFFGTFAMSSVGSQGAGITHLMPLLTSQLHYGMIDPTGGLEMRLSFDHRVLDGALVARGLAQMEEILLNDMVRDCSQIKDSASQSSSEAS